MGNNRTGWFWILVAFALVCPLGPSGCQGEAGSAHGPGQVSSRRQAQLLAVLKDPKHPASRRAFQELRDMGCRDEAYRTFLLKALATPEIRADDSVELLKAIAEIGDEVMPAVSRQLAGKGLSPSSQECHVFVLGLMGGKAQACVPQLRNMLEDTNKFPELLFALNVALADIAPDRPEHAARVDISAKIGDCPLMLSLRAMALTDSHGWVSDEIIAAAEKALGPSKASDDVVWALTFLGRQGEKAAGAKQKLKTISETGTWVPALFGTAALAGVDAADRPAAVRRLAKLADPGAMNDHTWSAAVRHAGLVIVGKETTAQLVKALDDRDDAVVRGAAYLLGLVGLPASGAWEKLAGLVRSNRAESVRMHAAMALVSVAPYESVKDLKILCGEARGAPGEIVKVGISVIELRPSGEPVDKAAVEAALMRSFATGSDRRSKVNEVMSKGSDEDILALVKDFDPNSKDPIDKTLLRCAARYGRVPAVDYLISKGAELLDKQGACAALCDAAAEGHVQVVATLLAHGAPIDKPKDWLPLLVAARQGKTEVVRLLLEKGADPKARNSADLDLLHEAASSGVKDLIALAIEKGADVNEKNRAGLTPLHQTVFRPGDKDNADAVRFLLAKGAAVNAADEQGMTALHFAVLSQARGAITALLDGGANINARGKTGETALDLANLIGDQKTTDLLRKRGAKTGRDLAPESGGAP